MQRSSGVLLHPTSLPGPAPVGDIGPAAYEWIDWLAGAGVSWWQVLPINPPGYAASPYQTISAFAGNPVLISPALLEADGLIDAVPPARPPEARVDFALAEQWKRPLLVEAAARVPRDRDFEAFCSKNDYWLDDFTLFAAIKQRRGGGPFSSWPEDLRRRSPDAVRSARRDLAAAIEEQRAVQFIFFDQWRRLREHAAAKGVRIIGDVPIFVSEDSAAVWTRPELFDLDENLRPRVVAGVPPDYFAETGQLWGNPLYDWQAHRAEGFSWWIDRLRFLLDLVDLVRIDHFRGFADYWEIPAGSATAEHGRWVLGPGRSFFDAVAEALSDLPFIAEDLGELHDLVDALREETGLPGMEIGQFAFDGEHTPPAEWIEHTVGYTGTHDNDTIRSWWSTATAKERAEAKQAGIVGDDVSWELISLVWHSASVLAITQLQDLLGLGGEARMNLPGTVSDDNWTWRALTLPAPELADQLRELNEATGR